MSYFEVAAVAALGVLLGGVLTYRFARTAREDGKGWREFFFQLLPAVVIGLGVIFFARQFLVHDDIERGRLTIDAVKDFGVVVVGVAIVEIVWVALGGSPVDRSLGELSKTTTELKTGLHDEMTAITQQFAATSTQFDADVNKMIGQFNTDVKGISRLVAGGARTGLVDVAESQDFLGYKPAKFVDDLLKANLGVDLCGATLNYVRQNELMIEALAKKADEGVAVRVILPAPDSQLLVALFQDEFLDEVRNGSTALANAIRKHGSKVQLRYLRKKALTMTMLRVDAAMLVTPYIFSSQTYHSPRFLIRGTETSLFRQYTKEFQALFDISDPAP